MIVNPNTFDSSISSDDVYQLVNTLPIGYVGLSQQMHYWGRLFGVITGEANEQNWDGFVINQCLRDAIWTTLRSTVDEAENFLGYNVTRRYHHETSDGWPFDTKIRVMPGIESVNKKPTFSVVTGLETVNVSPFVITGLLPQLDGSRYYILLDSAIIDNPNDILIRRSSDFGTYEADVTRRPTKVGSNWKVYLDNQPTTINPVEEISIQSTKYVYVDITTPTLTSGKLVPVYTGTNQIIPQAKDVQDLGGGISRYWFYIYTFVDPAFYNNPVDLVSAQYYKLVPIISFKKYEEVTAYGVLFSDCTCCQDCGGGNRRYQVTVNIVDAKRGIVSFTNDGELFDDNNDGVYERLDAVGCDTISRPLCPSCSYKLEFHYITNPIYLDDTLRLAISQILRAMMFRTAAELPLVDCGCWLYPEGEKMGFIARQQETFGSTSTNVFTGTTSVSYQYGDLRGQKAYAEIMSKVPRVKYVYI